MNLYKFFDYFGLLVFLFIFFDALFAIWKKEGNWRVWIRLFIGVAGILVDGYLVFFHG